MSSASAEQDLQDIQQRLGVLERRLALVEARCDRELGDQVAESPTAAEASTDAMEDDEALEMRIGENWFPKAGIIVLAIGVAFLLTFPYRGLPPVLPSLFGYVLVLGAFALSRHWRESFYQISRYILGGAVVLLYFTTLRLSFFSTDAAVTDRNIELTLLLAVVAIAIVISRRRKSVYLLGVSLAMGYLTALIGGGAPFVTLVCTALGITAVVTARRDGTPALLLYGTVMTYMTHLIWVMNNPVLGNPVHLIPFGPWTPFPLLLYAALFSVGTLFRRHPAGEEGIVIAGSFANGLLAYGLYLLLTLVRSGDAGPLYHGAASALFLVVSIAFWEKERSKYSTFLYAMLGYTAMSVSIIGQFDRPDYFVWLAYQSLVVITTAVWFRSQFIVMGNFVIFLILFAGYAALAGAVNAVSLSYGIVALASARILNWQRERLELKTEMMRNAYLTCAFFIFPYALYHALPAGFVSISWVVVAVFYYVMSILLKSRKYRWMALLTLCLTIGHVFIVDIVNLDPTFRIISFLVLGTVLLGISMAYAKRRGRAEKTTTESNHKGRVNL